MVENNGNFCLPNNLSYDDGAYHVRYYYPHLICCRHGGGGQSGMTSPLTPGPDGGPGPGSPATSPGQSPQRKPLLAHVEGASVVSKIARPPPHSPCTPPADTGGGCSPGGGAAAGSGGRARPRGGGGGGGGARSGVVVHQPSRTPASGPMFSWSRGRRHIHHDHKDDGGTETADPPSSQGLSVQNNGTTTSTPHTSDLEARGQDPSMGDGHQDGSGEGQDPGPTCCASPTGGEDTGAPSPVSPSSEDYQRPIFKLSDASDYSDDYTQMTDASLSSLGAEGEEEVVVGEVGQANGSSICSDVFSDRSSDTGGTLESEPIDLGGGAGGANDDNDDELTDPAFNDVDDEDDDIPKVFGRMKLDIDSPTERTLLLASGEVALPADAAKTSEEPDHDDEPETVTTPEITLEEVFDLQRDNLEEARLPAAVADYDDDDDRGGFYEDREFDFLKAQPVKRSTSLKSYKTPPGTPKRKMVRFADALGLDLESVRHILNLEAPPRIPQSATKDLKLEIGEDRGYKAPTQGARYLTACFAQPGINPTFPLMVRDRKVILENCVINDHNLSISGTVRVANIHFHKDVTLRYTTNSWLTFNDISAGYVQNSNDGPTDRFSFTVSLPHYFSTGSRLQFCIRYTTGGDVYWDNNHGRNYVIECYARAIPDSDNTWMSFL